MPQQRKRATTLFINIDGLYALTERIGSGRAADALWDKLNRLIDQYGGLANQPTGDNSIAIFGAPTAHEDDPERAVRAALALRDAFTAHSREQGWGDQARIRIAVNSGLILFNTMRIGGGFMAVGEAITTAGWLVRAFPEETLLIAHDTYRSVRGVFDVDPLPPTQFPGQKEPLEIYRVTGEKPRAFHLGSWEVEGIETRVIGRDEELRLLRQAMETAMAEKRTTAVTVIGEMGVGKSRFLHEFVKWVELLPNFYWLWQARAAQEVAQTPYALMRDLIVSRFEIRESDSAAVAQEKLERGVAEFLPEDGVVAAHFIGQLVGFDFSQSPHIQVARADAQQIRNRAFTYIVRLFKEMAQFPDSGALLFIDDMQWADSGSLALVEQIAKASPDLPFFIICLARPPFEWGKKLPNHIQIELPLLSREDSVELAANILRKIPELPPELPQQMADRAEGNPFYIEELARMLIEDKVIIPGPREWELVSDRLATADMPATLAGVLQAGLDGLPAYERDVLERAAVIGRVFWNGAVAYLAGANRGYFAPDALALTNAALAGLRERGLILKHKESGFADSEEYSFKHSFLHEVTYDGTLRRRQRAYHARAAEWHIKQSGERAAEYAGLIAAHLELAGEKERTAVYLAQAGEQAAAQFAPEAAVDYLTRALALMPEEDVAARYAILLTREKIYSLQGVRDAQKEDLIRLSELADKLGDNQKKAEVTLRRAYLADSTGDFATAVTAVQSSIALAQAAKDPALEAAGYLHWGVTLWRLGEHEESKTRLEQSLALAKTLNLLQVQADALRMLGNVLLREAQTIEAADYYHQSLEICRQIGDRKGEASALSNLGITARQLEDDVQSIAYYEEALEISHEIGFRASQSVILNNLGVIFSGRGNYLQAREQYENSLRIKKDVNDREGEALVGANLGVIYYYLGDYETSRRYCQEALTLAREMGARHVEGNALTNLGYTLTGLGELSEAAAVFQAAWDLRLALGQSNLVPQPQAGLAHVALAADDPVKALTYIEPVLAYMAENELDNAADPFRVYLAAYQTLQANEDPRATAVLRQAYTELKAQGAKINDEELRRSFFENVAAHRALAAAWRSLPESNS